MTEKATLRVSGMTCTGCENAVKRVVGQVAGVENVTASFKDGTVDVTYDPDKATLPLFKQKIQAIGYEVQ